MSKFIRIERVYRAVLNLPRWCSQANPRGARYLWAFLSTKWKDVTTGEPALIRPQDDRLFADTFMRVRDGSPGFYDPLVGSFDDRYHVELTAARKNVFANRWRAIRYDIDGQEYWSFSPSYLQIIEERVLTHKDRVIQVPVFDLIAWFYKSREFPTSTTLDDLLFAFRQEFHLSDHETSVIFTTGSVDGIPNDESSFFTKDRVPSEQILNVIEMSGGLLRASLPSAKNASREVYEPNPLPRRVGHSRAATLP